MTRFIACLTVLCLAPSLALAEEKPAAKADKPAEWGGPTVPYSADMVFTNDKGRSRTARLYYTSKKQRLEFKAGNEIVAIIFDHNANKAYQLLMNARTWRPIRTIIPQFNFGISDPSSTRKKLGEEKMGGLAVTKYQVSAKSRVGDEFDGTAWATKDRIIVKIVGIVARGKLKQRLTMVLQNLKVGPVDPTLFAVPAGYKKLPPLKKRN